MRQRPFQHPATPPCRRRVLGLLPAAVAMACAGLAGPAAQAVAERRVLAISALGETIDVVQHVPAIGSRLDRNVHQRVALPGADFDALAGQVAAQLLRRIEGVHVADVMAVTLAPEAAPLLQDERFTPDDALRRAVAEAAPTQVLLLLAWRTDSRLKLRNTQVGSGKLQGLGFYIDREIRVRRGDTGEAGQGMLAPYAYLKAVLVDASSGQVLRTETHAGSVSFSAARAPDGIDPWQALEATQKIAALHRLIRQGVAHLVPAAMATVR